MFPVCAEILPPASNTPALARTMFSSTSRREIDLPTEIILFGLKLMSYTTRPKRMFVYNENARASSALWREVQAPFLRGVPLMSAKTMSIRRCMPLFSLAVFGLFCLFGPARAQQIKSAIPEVARPLPLSAVRLTGGPLKHAQDLDIDYLLKLEPDRMMAYYRKRAGLEAKAPGYGGWDGDGRNLTGHIAGHYLSAVSLMYAATGDARFKERADYLVKERKEVQDKSGVG